MAATTAVSDGTGSCGGGGDVRRGVQGAVRAYVVDVGEEPEALRRDGLGAGVLHLCGLAVWQARDGHPLLVANAAPG